MTNIKIERKENGKWVHFAEFETNKKPAFMAAFEYVHDNCVAGHIVDTRHTYKGEKRVHYYKTPNAEKGFDFRATF